MDQLGHVEYLPEPEDARILSAIDPAAVGFQGAWRAEVTGWAPLEAAPVLRSRRQRAFPVERKIELDCVLKLLPYPFTTPRISNKYPAPTL